MGRKDMITKKYVSNPEVFADAFNQFVYRGQQIVKPERLREMDVTEIAVPYGEQGAALPEQKFRDVLKLLTVMTDGETAFCILGIETQSDIHYAMPVKNGLYDFMQLSKQVEEARKSHKAAGRAAGAGGSRLEQFASGGETDGNGLEPPTSGEYLSGFWKTDRLIPVVTLVIYFGADKWEAPLTLREMYACKDDWILDYAADYRVNLLAPGSLTEEEIELFRTNLREVMRYIKYSKDKDKIEELLERNEHFRQMDREAAEVINAVTNSKLSFKREEETTDMCLALDQIREECREQGREQGRAECRIEIILDLLEELSPVPEALRERVMSQRNPDILRKWLKSAIKADSIAEWQAMAELTA